MNLLIACDMEGVTGVVHPDQVNTTHGEYQRFRRLMTQDTNAAIEGALAAGVDEVIVSDGHAFGHNILVEELHPRARLHSGLNAAFAMVEGVQEKPDAAFFIGYHARAGTMHAILDHTWSSYCLADVRINERSTGETGLNAAVCGHFDVPVLMVSGDQALAAEARAWLPQAECAIVKTATGRNSGICLPPAQSHVVIRDAAQRAVEACKAGTGQQPLRLPAPLRLGVTFKSSEQADKACIMPGVERLDGTRLVIDCADMIELYRALRTLASLASK